jgi:hypothetical protein
LHECHVHGIKAAAGFPSLSTTVWWVMVMAKPYTVQRALPSRMFSLFLPKNNIPMIENTVLALVASA